MILRRAFEHSLAFPWRILIL